MIGDNYDDTDVDNIGPYPVKHGIGFGFVLVYFLTCIEPQGAHTVSIKTTQPHPPFQAGRRLSLLQNQSAVSWGASLTVSSLQRQPRYRATRLQITQLDKQVEVWEHAEQTIMKQ